MQILIEEITDWVAAGTVYTVFAVFNVGATWPKILYVVGIFYNPNKKTETKVSETLTVLPLVPADPT